MNPKVPKNITTIIFDLGGVLFDIDYSLTQKAFIALGASDFEKQYSQHIQNGLFDDFEKGKITSAHFRKELLKWLPTDTTEEQVNKAWNALLIGFPKEKASFLQNLKSKYRLFLLSNTNDIHLPAVFSMMDNDLGPGIMSRLFEKEYYSYKMGMRKPDSDIFEFVVKENALNPSTTLFIDDSIQNLKGAEIVGIQTLHCHSGINLFEYFS
jgi:putative hydrolase of the HAD superfamily